MSGNPFHISGPINPEKFTGRRALVREISTNLCLRNDENSYGIVGGHLFGRSSFLLFLKSKLISNLNKASHGDLHILPIYIGLNRAQTFTKASDVLGFILHTLRQATCRPERVHPLLEKPLLDLTLPQYTQISSSGADLQEIEDFIAKIVNVAYSQFGELRVVLLIDDADKMLNFPWTSTIFGNLHALIHGGDVSSSVRLVLAGSRSYIDVGVRGSPLSTSIIRRFLEPFTELEARRLIRRATGIRSEVAHEVFLQSGGHPFILQHMLYYLFQKDIKLANVEDVHAEIQHFFQDHNTVLQGWWRKIDKDGWQVYSIMREMEDWVNIKDIRQKTNDLNLQIDVGLNALYSHGFVVRNEMYQYRVCGQLFYEWSEPSCQIIQQTIMQTINIMTENDTMSNKNNQPLPGIQTSTITELAGIMARQAADSGGDPKEFFRMLVESVDMPEQWKWQIIGGWKEDVKYTALRLLNWARSKGSNPKDLHPQYTLLGDILNVLKEYTGRDDTRIIVAVIVSYQLCLNENLREEIAIQYRIPQIIHSQGQRQTGNGIWRGPVPENTEELQSWLKPDPPMLEIEFMKHAIEQACTVCCIKIPQKNRQGTGFLIAKNLVLTNYHLLQWFENEDIHANTQNMELRFGYTAQDKGKLFKLANNPIQKWSPKDELDYVLLRVEDSIIDAKDIQPVSYDLGSLHSGMAINIIQHPEGETMKIAINSNGVTHINQESGLVHYATKTKGGSSGSPCFNENWEVIALHRAEQATAFGSVGQGILFRLIHEQIKEFLPK